jgi:LysR family glycine cleavage system transcriptional activator
MNSERRNHEAGMKAATHLRSLQALEMALRLGSLKEAADALGITPAAVGQRIRALEDFLGTDLLSRGRSGLRPTVSLAAALDDLTEGFAALDRAADALDFRRQAEIHIEADEDWADLWLLPRLDAFLADNPNIYFNINGTGDAPKRKSAPDCRIIYGDPKDGEILYRDLILPVASLDNLRRFDPEDRIDALAGMPFLHLESQRDEESRPGWPEWIARFGRRAEGAARGIHYHHARHALEAVRKDVGFLVCGLSLMEADLDEGSFRPIVPMRENLVAPHPYVLQITPRQPMRPQMLRFCEWLLGEAAITARWLDMVGQRPLA